MRTRPQPGLSIIISGAAAALKPAIRRAARRTMLSQGYGQGRLEIALVDGTEMRRQHRQWMGLASMTDVLSFDLRDRPRRGRVDGQLIVCETVARRRAGRDDTDWRAEVLLYVVHGCLHLCGHDDHRAADAARMHRQEDELLSLLGWGPVFHGPARTSGCRERPPRRDRANRLRRGRL
jgi:probable rRNA maturation factor